MLETNEIAEQNSPELLKRLLWALTTFGIVLVFFFLAWLSIQRAKILIAQRRQYEAEAQTVVVQNERDAALRDRDKSVSELNQRLAKVEVARQEAENKLQASLANAAKLGSNLQLPSYEMAVPEPASAPPASAPPASASALAAQAVPSNEELTTFIRGHLSRMMAGPVEVEAADYAEEGVDFHGKRSTRRMIETERRAWAQKFPVRETVPQKVQPQITFGQRGTYPWLATAIFDWPWAMRSRTGSVSKGVSRDIWKIAPAADGAFKIVMERSVDPVTGASKD